MSLLYGYDMPIEFRSRIVDYCGGYIWLSTEALRHAHTTGNLEFNHPAMKYRLEAVWSGFSDKEQMTLTEILNQKPVTYKPSLEYLEKCGIVSTKQNSFSLTVPILVDYLNEKLAQETHLRLSANNEIILNMVPVTKLFSSRERTVLSFLISHSNELVGRPQLAKLFWNDGTDYSDWALDQAIKRLRKRLVILGLPENLIKTVKGKGCYFQRSSL